MRKFMSTVFVAVGLAAGSISGAHAQTVSANDSQFNDAKAAVVANCKVAASDACLAAIQALNVKLVAAGVPAAEVLEALKAVRLEVAAAAPNGRLPIGINKAFQQANPDVGAISDAASPT